MHLVDSKGFDYFCFNFKKLQLRDSVAMFPERNYCRENVFTFHIHVQESQQNNYN